MFTLNEMGVYMQFLIIQFATQHTAHNTINSSIKIAQKL